MKRRKTIGLLLLLGVGLSTYLLYGKSPPPPNLPRLDASTPAKQGGLTVLQLTPIDANNNAVYKEEERLSLWERMTRFLKGQNAPATRITSISNIQVDNGRGGAGIWIRLPAPTPPPSGLRYDLWPTHYRATGRAPNGETFPLLAQWGRVGAQPFRALLVGIPGGYPESFKYLDVSVEAGKGHTGTWRILLPPAHRVISEPVTAEQGIARTEGFTLSGRTWRLPKTASKKPSEGTEDVHFDVRVTGRPMPRGEWELRKDRMDWEWHETSPNENARTITTPAPEKIAIEQTVPYGAYNRYARLKGTLQNFDILDETVTFRNLAVLSTPNEFGLEIAQEQTVTTPSGIKVTLPVQKPLLPGPLTGNQGGLGFQLRYPTSAEPGTLPDSPLYKKHHAKLEIDLVSVEPPFRLGFRSLTEPQHRVSVLRLQPSTLPKLSNGSHIDLTLVIRQRVKAKDYPFTLTVPIEAKPPQNWH